MEVMSLVKNVDVRCLNYTTYQDYMTSNNGQENVSITLVRYIKKYYKFS